MRKHIGVVAGSAVAVVGFVLAIASLSGFALGLPAVQPATALGASWFMVAVVMLFAGSFAALIARGIEILAEEQAPARMPLPVRELHAVRH